MSSNGLTILRHRLNVSSEVDVEVKRCRLRPSRPLDSLWRALSPGPSRADVHVQAAVVVYQHLLSKDERICMRHVYN